LKLSCAAPCDIFLIRACNKSNRYLTNRTSDFSSSAMKPITLSGKQASMPNKAASAIFAAIVTHKVLTGQSLLCFNPSLEYICVNSFILKFAALTSAVCTKGNSWPYRNSAFLGLCLDFPLPTKPKSSKMTFFHSFVITSLTVFVASGCWLHHSVLPALDESLLYGLGSQNPYQYQT